MASPAPAKLQPLHNFSFTHLKWKNHRSGRSRLAGETSSSSPPPSSTWRESSSLRSHTHAPSPPHRCQTSPPNGFRRPSPLDKQSPMRDSEFEADQNYSSQFIEKTGKRIITESSAKSLDNNNKRKRSNKISIRIRENSNRHDAAAEENHSSTPMDDSVPPPAAAAGEDELSPKTWNLRPRRPPVNHKQSSTGGLPKIGTSRLQEIKTSHETVINKQLPELNTNNNTGMRKSKKQKFSIPLSRGEIEEDVFLLTGSKPSRRPKKRPRAIQRQLDNLFPGLWLDSITADSYKVSEASTKG
ncbi:uncharacterized protein LOC112502561 [Cynara cardunculus var. scolymus]|uniref:uncharacterized protein LOC112502561 n=1 Tax=Cynara cardunculus var. scolymus TaxID=59895 RepID=UPI000D629FA5|nr:uncharacterized protein LOC112502561 [Cynara cardunculus var. scolymus]